MKEKRSRTLKLITIASLTAIVLLIITIQVSTSNASPEAAYQKPAGKVIILSDANFNETIKKGVTLVDFWAIWCGPCKTQNPIIEKVAEEIGSKAKICKLDTDKNPVTTSKYNVNMIPTLIVFKNGIVIQKYVGVQQKDVLVKKIKELL